MRWQGSSRRKMTGGKIVAARGKRKFEMGREFAETRISEIKRKNVHTMGGNRKVRLLQCNVANVTNPKDGKIASAQIERVLDNIANKHYVRRNILTKGSVIRTTLGTARVTSRPGQDGVVNAVLIE
ncbi:MAG: 30S ribosomal protein S8e [Methanosarcina sp.]|jgi:small subunit ribosomal protein S8e|nr:30S ribosomal protein S8e [Methanosarcina sp.]MDD3317625.1 30S ribosomal protein S8e [Methanosarcina sp.]MDD4306626.1 30S ribosomal protein S8e [Methanosarcina sp.]MDD4620568.1 30S ribosomal protein S8e [Methanosarcina sp.]